jgi:hypothetical protein
VSVCVSATNARRNVNVYARINVRKYMYTLK